MADGNGLKIASRANYQRDTYVFSFNSGSASTHDLEIGDSGKTYLTHCTFARTINLPAPATGASYKFIVTNSTVASTINCESTQLYGVYTDAEGVTAVSGSTTVNINTAAALGDWLEFLSDGNNWYVRGQCAADNGFTVG